MTWRLARSLETLRAQINRIAPNRSKVSDGTIGDAKHASRSSDHNPWAKDGGVGDITLTGARMIMVDARGSFWYIL